MPVIAALFRLALALCPPGFRREYGGAIASDFAIAFAEERAVRGPSAAAVYACEATIDLFATAFREYAAMFVRDLVFSLRSLRKTPSFTAVVVATLGLAIGANAAVFSILNTVVLAPLPYPHADRLVADYSSTAEGESSVFSLPDFADLVRRNPSTFAASAAFVQAGATITGDGEPMRARALVTTPKLFEVLGVEPELGRFATEDDVRRGAAKTIVISDGLWRSRFRGDPNVVGRMVTVDGVPRRVIGVAPASFRQPVPQGGIDPIDLWQFVAEDGAGTAFADRGFHSFRSVSRLPDGVSLQAANATAGATAGLLRARYPNDDALLSMTVGSLDESIVGRVKPVIFAIFAAVGAVLLVACANVANLLLSRAAARRGEFSIRIAVGASRGRIVGQLLVEAFALSAAGGIVGIGLAYAAIAAFERIKLESIPRADLVTVDLPSILFTLGAVAFCTFAAGIVPGLTTSTSDVATALKSAGRGGDTSRGGRARGALVAGEIAITLALVVAAGLVVRSYYALTTQPLGFDGDRVAIVGPVDISEAQVPNQSAKAAMMGRIVRAVRAVPGVESAGWGLSVPFTHSRMGVGTIVDGTTVDRSHEPDSTLAPTGTGFFEAMRATMLAGRAFAESDTAATLPVAIVNETFVRRFFPHGSALGKHVTADIALGDARPTKRTIVGVVRDLRPQFVGEAPPTIYVPSAQFAIVGSYLAIRSVTDVTTAVRAAIASVDPLIAKPDSAPLSSLLAGDVAAQRLTVASLGTLAFIALALSLAGVFAVMSYGVTQRTHEFGIRMALGADARQILVTVLSGAARIALVGVGLGLVLAGIGTRLLVDELYETQPLDPAVFGGVAAIMIAFALFAALVPARRATRVDPIVALRYE